MADFYALLREKTLTHSFNPIVINKVDKTASERSKKYYHAHRGEPEFEEMQKEKRKRKYDSMKADPVRWERYLQQCRESKARRKSALASNLE